jgi:hypothetical protein
VDDAELVRLGLAAAESIEAGGATRAAGIVRQLVRRVAEIAQLDIDPSADRCASCGGVLTQPATGRRRRYCPRRWCQEVSRHGGKTREKAMVGP